MSGLSVSFLRSPSLYVCTCLSFDKTGKALARGYQRARPGCKASAVTRIGTPPTARVHSAEKHDGEEEARAKVAEGHPAASCAGVPKDDISAIEIWVASSTVVLSGKESVDHVRRVAT